MVIAGALEDPFATASLAERMPALIRRFVNRFRQSLVTSFETLESTMTVHGAEIARPVDMTGCISDLGIHTRVLQDTRSEEHPDAGVHRWYASIE